jgi:hypothetical protein
MSLSNSEILFRWTRLGEHLESRPGIKELDGLLKSSSVLRYCAIPDAWIAMAGNFLKRRRVVSLY